MKIVKLVPNKYAKFHFGLFNLEINDYVFHSDSLFGAIVTNYVRLFGTEELNSFVNSFPVLSSLFYGIRKNGKEVYFIPSPKDKYIPKDLLEEDRKLIKKVKFVSFNYYEKLITGNLNNDDITVNNNKDLLYLKEDGLSGNLKLFDHYVEEKVSINRKTGMTIDNHLYTVSSIILDKDVFFYFLIDGELSEPLEKSIKAIEFYGIGGERSIGYGGIERVSISEFDNEFDHASNCKKFMTLSLLHPTSDEIETVKKGRYTLIERKGWVLLYGKNYIRNGLPKRPLFYIGEGSVFNKQLTGMIKEEIIGENKIFRYGKALMIPFNPISGGE